MRQRLLDLVLLLPVLPFASLVIGALALMVLVLDGRPIFFTQARLGKRRRPFTIYKLRTMTAARQPTRLGKWLRARGLDELPQLFNVLKGDMALVGPRPLETRDIERLTSMYPPFAARFAVKPGLTGPAQVAQPRSVEATAELEAEYARSASAAFDLRLLGQTTWILLVGKQRGARRLQPRTEPKCPPHWLD
jgi:lipopolysaccharide/colanic/teichoic acid biosynthesis glycosyltransferase